MHVDSREYQCRLQPRLFGRPDAAALRLFGALAELDDAVAVRLVDVRTVHFTRALFDTASGSFAREGLKLRTRAYRERVACTFKAIGHDRYAVEAMHVDCVDRGARAKFEEGIYAYHSAFSKQSSTNQTVGSLFRKVGDWARLFPGALAHAEADVPLLRTALSFVRRTNGFALDFAGVVAKASLDLYYADASLAGEPTKIELSWKYRDKREAYRPEAIRGMRRFLQAVNQSPWGAPEVHLEKAKADAVSTLRDGAPAFVATNALGGDRGGELAKIASWARWKRPTSQARA